MYKTPELLGAPPSGPKTILCPASVTNTVSKYAHLTVIKCLYPLSFWGLHPLTPAEKRSTAGPTCLPPPPPPKKKKKKKKKKTFLPLPVSPLRTNIGSHNFKCGPPLRIKSWTAPSSSSSNNSSSSISSSNSKVVVIVVVVGPYSSSGRLVVATAVAVILLVVVVV